MHKRCITIKAQAQCSFTILTHPPSCVRRVPTPAVTTTVPVPHNSQGRNREPRPARPIRCNEDDVFIFNWRKSAPLRLLVRCTFGQSLFVVNAIRVTPGGVLQFSPYFRQRIGRWMLGVSIYYLESTMRSLSPSLLLRSSSLKSGRHLSQIIRQEKDSGVVALMVLPRSRCLL